MPTYIKASMDIPKPRVGETVEACAIRELNEETGPFPLSIELGPWTRDVIDEKKHYISLFAIITKFEGEPQLLEPDKCESWDWYLWDELPTPLFSPLAFLVKSLGIEQLKEMTEPKSAFLMNLDMTNFD